MKVSNAGDTGALLGALSDRGRGTIMSYDMYSSYNNIALGLMSTVASLSAFGSTREMFSREAASGLKKCAHPCKACHASSALSLVSTFDP